MQQEQNKLNQVAPAFPPQVMQDNFGRMFAAMPGMSKLEFTSAIILPVILQLNSKTSGMLINGKKVSVYEAAEFHAIQLLNHLNKQDEKETISIVAP